MKRINKKITSGIITALITVLTGGCAVGPDYQKPETVMPDAWHQKVAEKTSADQDVTLKWWETFGDEILDSLISEAKENNYDLETAYWRVRQARALRDFNAGVYYPVIDATGSYSRVRPSQNSISPPPSGHSQDQYNLHSAGFDAFWEIDMFGQTSRAVESSQATLEAEIENYRDVLVTVYGEVARNYVDLRTAQERIRYALRNIETQKETLELTQSRYKNELAPQLDVEQAKLNLANTQAQIPLLRSAEKAAINRLSVLTGKRPAELYEELIVFKGIPAEPEKIEIILPVELLRQRPDIRSAERELAAQTARIGVATADLYPAFSLNGTLTLEALNLHDMGNLSSRKYSVGPAMRWNIFDGDRIRNNIRIEESLTEQLYSFYQNTVLLALEEVENAMTDYSQETIRRDALAVSVTAARKSVELVDVLYKSGLTDFQNVLDMQRTLVQQEDALAESQGNVINNLIRIYKAFGGGWTNEDIVLSDGMVVEKGNESNNEINEQ